MKRSALPNFVILTLVVSFRHTSGQIQPATTCTTPICKYTFAVTNIPTASTWHGETVLQHLDGAFYVIENNEPRNISISEFPEGGFIVADGYTSMALAINNQIPGPTIRVTNKVEWIVVDVTNKMVGGQSLSMHWHGMHQENTIISDGAQGVTECGILSGETLTYRFKPDPTGTSWYHSHTSSEFGEGVLGALVVVDVDDPHKNLYDVDEDDYLVFIQDWMHKSSYEVNVMDRNAWGFNYDETDIPRPVFWNGIRIGIQNYMSGFINGRGRMKNRADVKRVPLTQYKVKKGLRYRFRTVSGAVQFPFRVSIDGHPLSLITASETNLVPVKVDSFILFSGERFDFVIEANQPPGNYLFRAASLQTNLPDGEAPYEILAVLTYEDEPDPHLYPPKSEAKGCHRDELTNECLPVANCPWQEYVENPKPGIIQPYQNCLLLDELQMLPHPESFLAPPQNEEVTETFFINYNSFPDGLGGGGPGVAGRHFKTPNPPALSKHWIDKEYDNDCKFVCPDPVQDGCTCVFTIDLELGKTYDFVWSTIRQTGTQRSATPHPIHVHGNPFWILKVVNPAWNETTQKADTNRDIECLDDLCVNARWRPGLDTSEPDFFNTVDPPRVDTVNVQAGGYVVARLRADNPGVWFQHCHTETHLLQGMGLFLVVGREQVFGRNGMIDNIDYDFPLNCRDYKMDADSGDVINPSEKNCGASFEGNSADLDESFWRGFGVGSVCLIVVSFVIAITFHCCNRRLKTSYARLRSDVNIGKTSIQSN